MGGVMALLLLSEYVQILENDAANTTTTQSAGENFSIGTLVCTQLTIAAFILLERLMLSLYKHD